MRDYNSKGVATALRTAVFQYAKNRKLQNNLTKVKKIILKNRQNRVIPLLKTFKMRYHMPMFEVKNEIFKFRQLKFILKSVFQEN